MRFSKILPLAAAALALASGCGGVGAPPQTPAATHGGVLAPLPKSAGYLEYLAEPIPSAKTATTKSWSPNYHVVAYLTNNQGSAPPNPAPTSVSFTAANGKAFTLSPHPATDQDPSSLRFTTDQPPLTDRDVAGSFDVKLGAADSFNVSARPR